MMKICSIFLKEDGLGVTVGVVIVGTVMGGGGTPPPPPPPTLTPAPAVNRLDDDDGAFRPSKDRRRPSLRPKMINVNLVTNQSQSFKVKSLFFMLVEIFFCLYNLYINR